MKILFQGDSITDAFRITTEEVFAGHGYVTLIRAALGYKEPGKYEVLNRGVAGDRIIDVYARIKEDIINIKPDVLTLLVGVNDVWHEFAFHETPNGVDADKYYKIYDMLIDEVKTALPDTKIIIMGSFLLKASATKEKWEMFRSEVEKRAEMAKKIAVKYNLPYVELQKGFDELDKTTPEGYWCYDGVHPTAMGHEFIKNKWLECFESL